MTADEDHALLEAYVAAATIPRVRTDRRKYPIYVGRIAPLGMDVLALQVEEALHDLADRGVDSVEIATALRNPTRIMRALHTFNEGLIAAGASKERRQAFALRLLRLAQELKAGDVLCRDGNNLVLSAEEAEDLARSVGSMPAAEPYSARAFQRLAAILWSASESLYFACHGVAREQHGVYRLPGGEALIVRDYCELAPAELWPGVPWPARSSIRLLAWHTAGAKVEWDVFNNLYVNGPALAETLSAVAVITDDGTPLSPGACESIAQELLTLVNALTRQIDSWNEQAIGHQYLRVLWWQVRPLMRLLGVDWQPPEPVFERLAAAGVRPHSDKQPDEIEIRTRMDLF